MERHAYLVQDCRVVEFIGVDHFGTVKAVELFPRGRPVRDFSAEDRANLESALDSVKTLPQVELVNLLASRVNDGELAKPRVVRRARSPDRHRDPEFHRWCNPRYVWAGDQ